MTLKKKIINAKLTLSFIDIREFKIFDATEATTPQSLHITKTKPLHALHVLLFLYISFLFSTNMRREKTISQVTKRT